MATKPRTNTKTTTTTEKKLNDTVTALFADPRWGEDKEGNPNYISAAIDPAAFDILAKVQIGDRLKFKRVTSKDGKEMAYLELIKNNGYKGKGTKNEGSETTGF